MNFTQLEYFVSVAELLSFSKAAEKNIVAQTAVSYNINALEKELGFRLFERTTRSVRLTAAGEKFYNGVTGIMADMNRLISDITEKTQEERELVVGFSGISASEKFIKIIEEFKSSYTEIHTTIVHKPIAFELVKMLEAGKIDAACYFEFENINDRNLVKYVLDICDNYVFLPPDHRLADRESVTMQELENETHIVLRTPPRGKKRDLFKSSNIIVASDLSEMEMLILSHSGVAILPYLNDNIFRNLVAVKVTSGKALVKSQIVMSLRRGDNKKVVKLFNKMLMSDEAVYRL